MVVGEEVGEFGDHGHERTTGHGQDRSTIARDCEIVDTAARLLRLLVLISSRGAWQADELADRLEVTTRTLRRDVTRLRTLGYPIESTTGPYGGYSLGSGGRLPPLLFDDDEAVAAVAGLRGLMRSRDELLAGAAMSALTKIGQVLPSALRERVDTLTEVTVGLGWPESEAPDSRTPGSDTPAAGETADDRRADAAEPVQLMDVAVSCRRGERVRFDYRSGADVGSSRHAEPHRLVSSGRRWYLVAFDLGRDDWRTFRVDRIRRWVRTGVPAAVRPVPDAAALVSEGIAVRVFDTQAEVRFDLSPEQVARIVHPTIGVIDADRSTATSTTVRIGGDADWVARYLISLPCDVEVVEPDEVRHEIVRMAEHLARRHAEPVHSRTQQG